MTGCCCTMVHSGLEVWERAKKSWNTTKEKNFALKIYWNFPLNLRVLPAEGKYPQILQKMNAKCPHISDEKKKLPFWQITFHPLKLGSKDFYQISDKKHKFFLFYRYVTFDPKFKGWKVICQRGNSFFIRNLRAFCIYSLLNIRIWG